MHWVQVLLGTGMVVSGFYLGRIGLRNNRIAEGVIQLIVAAILVVAGAYTIYDSLTE